MFSFSLLSYVRSRTQLSILAGRRLRTLTARSKVGQNDTNKNDTIKLDWQVNAMKWNEFMSSTILRLQMGTLVDLPFKVGSEVAPSLLENLKQSFQAVSCFLL